jgi:hypothetical protein
LIWARWAVLSSALSWACRLGLLRVKRSSGRSVACSRALRSSRRDRRVLG